MGRVEKKAQGGWRQGKLKCAGETGKEDNEKESALPIVLGASPIFHFSCFYPVFSPFPTQGTSTEESLYIFMDC